MSNLLTSDAYPAGPTSDAPASENLGGRAAFSEVDSIGEVSLSGLDQPAPRRRRPDEIEKVTDTTGEKVRESFEQFLER